MKKIDKSFVLVAEKYIDISRLLNLEELPNETSFITDLAELEDELCAFFKLPNTASCYGQLQKIAIKEECREIKIQQLFDFLNHSATEFYLSDAQTDDALLKQSRNELRSPLDVLPLLEFNTTRYACFLLSGLYYQYDIDEKTLLQELLSANQPDLNELHLLLDPEVEATPELLQQGRERFQFVDAFYAKHRLAQTEPFTYIQQGPCSTFKSIIPDGTEYWLIHRMSILTVRFVKIEHQLPTVCVLATIRGKRMMNLSFRNYTSFFSFQSDDFREALRSAPDYSTAGLLWNQFVHFMNDPDYALEYRTDFDLTTLYDRPLLLDAGGQELQCFPEESGLD